jgi:hypothetical protein
MALKITAARARLLRKLRAHIKTLTGGAVINLPFVRYQALMYKHKEEAARKRMILDIYACLHYERHKEYRRMKNGYHADLRIMTRI